MARQRNLTFERQIEILSRVAELVEESDAYSAAMYESGRRAWMVWPEFERNFCPLSCRGCAFAVQQLQTMVRSPSPLRLKRDANLKRPCSDIRDKAWINEPEKEELARRRLNQDYIKYLEEEHGKFGYQDDVSRSGEYITYYRGVLEDAFSKYGFERDVRKSSDLFPVVSKSLNLRWDICWSPQTSRTLLWWPRKRSGDEAWMSDLDLVCYIRRRGSIGFAYIPIQFKTANIMRIKIEFFMDGFAWAYFRHDGPEDLPLVVDAYASLYGLVAPKLEAILQHELQDE